MSAEGAAPAEPPVEASPLWPVLVVLADIAERLVREAAAARREGGGDPEDADEAA